MAISNRDRVGKALELLGAALGPYVDRRMSHKTPMGGNWKAAYDGNLESDPSALIGVILDHWAAVFRSELKGTGRNLLGEARDWRNEWAHNKPISTSDAYRALDTIERLLDQLDAPEMSEVGKSKADLQRSAYEAEARSATPRSGALLAEPAAGLKPWREVVVPHEDVARGKYALAEFAANLYQVAKGEGLPEYKDPIEFFRRTYLTAGLRTMLTQAAQRITGIGGAPVVNLQTSFGGGKTHSMIALYHLFSGREPTAFPQEVQELFEAAGVKDLPQVTRAVLVGTQLSPGQADTKPDGTVVRTLWGEIAWRLGGKDAFELVAEADRTATNPGAAIEDVLQLCSPCLILIDEWVAYARQMLGGEESLVGGSFGTQFTFAQTLADAAIAVPGALLVVSLPVSDDPARPGLTPIGSEAELGGAAGQEAARRLGNVLGRVETPWRPASAEESFEIVRRRLFQPVATEQVRHRDGTARAFGEFYRNQSAEFPSEAHEPAYIERIKQAYPIHPELFARLYEDWSTLEGFQRTRGVLRLMAAVISVLWSGGDQSPLILPANVALDAPAVQAELTRSLDPSWHAIIDTDVDGSGSVPHKVDVDYPNLGRYGAARRAARTVFLASAPRLGSPNLGVELQRVKLGCALPGEAVATYGDALNRLTDRSSYLYVEGSRYWYGTQASVARRARDLIDQYLTSRKEEVHAHIVARLTEVSRDRGEFCAAHVCPANPAEVPDIAECRMVVLPPTAAHINRDSGSDAMLAAKALLEQRGNAARQYRNMLVFLAPDRQRLADLERAVAEHLAWTDIHSRWEELGLDAAGRNQAESKKKDADRAVALRVGETYHWALMPHQPDPTGPIEWETTRTDGQGGIVSRASRKLINNGILGVAYAAELLRGLLGTDGTLAPLWSEGHITVNDLWDAFARYVYLPRLRDLSVLTRTVAAGPNSITWEQRGFAVADSYEQAGDRYINLVAGATAGNVTGTSLVVRSDLAAAQLARDASATGVARPGTDGAAGEAGSEADSGTTLSLEPQPPRRFHAVARLDAERYQRDFHNVAQEIITNLAGHLGTDIEITVEIDARNPGGFPESVVRTVLENSRTLKLDHPDFEQD